MAHIQKASLEMTNEAFDRSHVLLCVKLVGTTVIS